MYITQIYGVVLQKAISFEVHIQSDIRGYTLYVADLGVGRGFVVTGDNFEVLIKNIMGTVSKWRKIVEDPSQKLITNEDDIEVLKTKINEWYKGK
jgi:hypothetical protein